MQKIIAAYKVVIKYGIPELSLAKSKPEKISGANMTKFLSHCSGRMTLRIDISSFGLVAILVIIPSNSSNVLPVSCRARCRAWQFLIVDKIYSIEEFC